MPRATYRLEGEGVGGRWFLLETWQGLTKGETDGALMVLGSLYGVRLGRIRAVCEPTGVVYRELHAKPFPVPASSEES